MTIYLRYLDFFIVFIFLVCSSHNSMATNDTNMDADLNNGGTPSLNEDMADNPNTLPDDMAPSTPNKMVGANSSVSMQAQDGPPSLGTFDNENSLASFNEMKNPNSDQVGAIESTDTGPQPDSGDTTQEATDQTTAADNTTEPDTNTGSQPDSEDATQGATDQTTATDNATEPDTNTGPQPDSSQAPAVSVDSRTIAPETAQAQAMQQGVQAQFQEQQATPQAHLNQSAEEQLTQQAYQNPYQNPALQQAKQTQLQTTRTQQLEQQLAQQAYQSPALQQTEQQEVIQKKAEANEHERDLQPQMRRDEWQQAAKEETRNRDQEVDQEMENAQAAKALRVQQDIEKQRIELESAKVQAELTKAKAQAEIEAIQQRMSILKASGAEEETTLDEHGNILSKRDLQSTEEKANPMHKPKNKEDGLGSPPISLDKLHQQKNLQKVS